MQKTAKFIYADHDDVNFKQNFVQYFYFQCQVLGMPYTGGEVFMFIVLPKERFGLKQLLANMTGAKLLTMVQNTKWKLMFVFRRIQLQH